eukprot:gene9135-1641_t
MATRAVDMGFGGVLPLIDEYFRICRGRQWILEALLPGGCRPGATPFRCFTAGETVLVAGAGPEIHEEVVLVDHFTTAPIVTLHYSASGGRDVGTCCAMTSSPACDGPGPPMDPSPGVAFLQHLSADLGLGSLPACPADHVTPEPIHPDQAAEPRPASSCPFKLPFADRPSVIPPHLSATPQLEAFAGLYSSDYGPHGYPTSFGHWTAALPQALLFCKVPLACQLYLRHRQELLWVHPGREGLQALKVTGDPNVPCGDPSLCNHQTALPPGMSSCLNPTCASVGAEPWMIRDG